MRRIPTGITATLIGALGFALGAAAQDPADITPGFGNGLGTSDIIDDHIYPQGTILMDQLDIVDNQAYIYANGNTLGGAAIFGLDYDLQLCDDMTIDRDFRVTEVTVDSVGFLGGAPVQLPMGLYADVDGRPDSDDTYEADWPVTRAFNWPDPVFGLFGVRATANGDSGCTPAGHYWVKIQNDTRGGDGDWYYTCRDDGNRGGDTFGREGYRGNGYGTYIWTSMEAFGYGRGDTSMQVVGRLDCGGFALEVFGECPGTMDLTVSGATPGETVYFAAGLAEGETAVPGCSGLSVDIANARLAGTATADENGVATITGFVPEPLCDRVIVQAVSHSDCLKSNAISL